jgi:hypothetical protein
VLATALVPFCAFAVDGVVLISQATIVAAGGFPYVISQTGSYRLSGNLVVPGNADAISITADNVTLDLNGFSIIGPAVCSGGPPVTSCSGNSGGTGVNVIQANRSVMNTTVINGTVTGMREGLNLGSGSYVDKMHIHSNTDSGVLINRGPVTGSTIARGTVTGSTITNNLHDGIQAFFSTVIGNTISGNGGGGFDGQASTISSNTFTNNGSGIIVGCPATIMGNTAVSNTVNLSAVVLYFGMPCTIANNTAP